MARKGTGTAIAEVVAVLASLKNSFPILEDEAVVTVAGNPSSTRKSLYFLAAAVAFGMVKRYDTAPKVTPPPGMMSMQYDAASNEVTFSVRYRTCLISSDDAPGLRVLPLYQGPPESTVGGPWNFTGATLDFAGLPAAPNLPNQKQPILSRLAFDWSPDPAVGPPPSVGVASPNARPLDFRSRGSLYMLVYTALTTPQGAGLKEFPLPVVAGNLVGA